MVVVQVLWPHSPQTAEQATRLAEKSAPKFRGKPGLHSKHYLRERETGLGGGMYVWESREAAEAYFTAAWRARMTSELGHEPQVRYFDVPLVIDNTREIA